jgi:ferredoxin
MNIISIKLNRFINPKLIIYLEVKMVKISVDKKLCIGCGACVSICPASFEMKDGKSVAKKSKIDKITCEKEAAESCPVAAIKVSD